VTSRSEVLLLDRHTGKVVDAVLIDGLAKHDIERAEALWRPAMDAAVKERLAAGKPIPQHHHWDWRKKHAHFGAILLYQFLGIECAGDMQGMMMLETAGCFCRDKARLGKGLVQVTFLATAPWNSLEAVDNPRYKHVGSVLIRAAIAISDDLGFSGCIGLHALQQAEQWYAKHGGMTDFGFDAAKKMRYFEMTVAQAAAFVRGD
jgi:hypothetical protein